MNKRRYEQASGDELAREARGWDAGEAEHEGWREAPEAVPRAGASTAISLRVPRQMLDILKAFARREGVGYQVLMKRWLDDRIRQERGALVGSATERAEAQEEAH
jgi:hypothetical protein